MSKMSVKKQNLISLVIIIVGIILAFFIFGSKKGKEVQTEKIVFPTKVEILTIGEITSKVAQISKTAVLESVDSADAVAEQAGRISQVNFKTGDQVQKGQVLAIFNQSSSVNSAKVALEDSLQNLSLAEDNLKKTRKSTEESLEIAKNNKHIDELELEQAEDSGVQDDIDLAEKNLDNSKDAEDKAKEDVKILINNAKIQVSQAQATVRQNQIAYEKSIIRAPISGLITTRNVNRYDYISVGTKIAEISGANKLNAKVFLSRFEVNKINEEDPVTLTILNKDYLGKIYSLSTVANSNNNRYEVRVESLDDISAEANRFAQVKFKLNLDSENTFFIPLSAVSIGQQENTVFVEDGGESRMKQVKIGKTVGEQIEIISGLENGDRVIVKNNRGLRNGEKVEIQ